MVNRNKKIIMILSTVFTVVLALSFTYAFFYYGKEGSTITLKGGTISINFEEDVNYLTLHDTYPKSDSVGMISTNYYDFTVSGSNGKYDDILYEIQIEQLEDNTLAEEYINVYLTDQEDNGFFSVPKKMTNLPISKYNNNRIVYSDYIVGENQVDDYRLRVWVDESYTKNVQETFKFKVVLYAVNDDALLLYEEVEEKLASYLLPADGDGDYDARIISSAQNDENLKNYVWYSGKLWRIVALNNNGTIKMVTDNSITAIAWGDVSTYEDSYMYRWLKEEFLSTLYRYKNMLVLDYPWNATAATENTKPANITIVESPVGALNAYEVGQSNGYLSNGYSWMTMTPYDGPSSIWFVDYGLSKMSVVGTYGVRPSINLVSSTRISEGEGTFDNPYRLAGDIEKALSNELLNTRMSGEYIKFNETTYRIVGVEKINNQKFTKITMADYSKNNNSINTSQIFSGSDTITEINFTEKYGIGLYLKNWYNDMPTIYKKMIATDQDGILWYQGPENGVGNDYTKSKSGIGISAKIGLPYLGEVFSSQFGSGPENSISTWLMTKGSTSWVWVNNKYNADQVGSPVSVPCGVRPSMYLKSVVKIGDTNGDGDFGDGTIEHPYEIVMN